MLYYLGQWIKLLIGIGVLGFLLFYNPWLQKQHHCSAMTFGGVAMGAIDCFLWFGFRSCDGFLWHVVLLILAAAGFVFLYAYNYEQSDDLLQSLFMAVWQILAGLLVIGFFIFAKQKHDRKK